MSDPTVFRSRIDLWLVLVLLAAPVIQVVRQWPELSSSFWLALGVAAAIFLTFFPIRYVLEGDTVSIQCGVFGWEYQSFRIQDVRAVKSTWNPLAAPALSLDRLSIDLGVGGEILISPKDKDGFLRMLSGSETRTLKQE